MAIPDLNDSSARALRELLDDPRLSEYRPTITSMLNAVKEWGRLKVCKGDILPVDRSYEAHAHRAVLSASFDYPSSIPAPSISTKYFDPGQTVTFWTPDPLDEKFEKMLPELKQKYPDEWVTIDADLLILHHSKKRSEASHFVSTHNLPTETRTWFVRVNLEPAHVE